MNTKSREMYPSSTLMVHYNLVLQCSVLLVYDWQIQCSEHFNQTFPVQIMNWKVHFVEVVYTVGLIPQITELSFIVYTFV